MYNYQQAAKRLAKSWAGRTWTKQYISNKHWNMDPPTFSGTDEPMKIITKLIDTNGYENDLVNHNNAHSTRATFKAKTIAHAGNKSIVNSGAGSWSNRQHIAISFGSGGRNSFEHQNKIFNL